jgi:hypothetical protein
MAERFERWTPIEGLSGSFISAEVWIDFPAVGVRLVDGRVEVNRHRDLIVLFEDVAAVRVHEEFVHPTQGTTWGREPTVSASDHNTFPCLIVHDSSLFLELKQTLFPNYAGATH